MDVGHHNKGVEPPEGLMSQTLDSEGSDGLRTEQAASRECEHDLESIAKWLGARGQYSLGRSHDCIPSHRTLSHIQMPALFEPLGPKQPLMVHGRLRAART